MAEQAEKKAEAPAPAPAKEEKKAATGGLMKSTPVLLGIVMILEAAVLFAGFKFLGSGATKAQGAEIADKAKSADGESKADSSAKSEKKVVEVPIVRFKPMNDRSGRRILYDIWVVASVKSEHEQRVKDTIKAREAYIQDRIRTIVAQIDPQKLGGGVEPGLETLRRQVKYQLDEIIGEGMIDEVLVPSCTPYRADF